MITVKVIKDSIGPAKVRITTFAITYPRFIHAEFMTHRMFSRNASSSRAIPVLTMLKRIQDNPATPIYWGKDQRGMQANSEVSGWRLKLGKLVWQLACYNACWFAKMLDKLGFHKQIVNRLTEPFAHITVVVTATEWVNFFGLRYHEAAQPEIHELARQMYDAYRKSKPKKLKEGQWHLPFTDQRVYSESNIWRSVACCARVSYMNHDKSYPNDKQNKKLYDMLLGSQPIHASPAEHQAEALGSAQWSLEQGNFRGWRQYRKTLEGENMLTFEKNNVILKIMKD